VNFETELFSFLINGFLFLFYFAKKPRIKFFEFYKSPDLKTFLLLSFFVFSYIIPLIY